VIRDAMSREKVDGLGRVVLSARERPMLVAVMGKGPCGVSWSRLSEQLFRVDKWSVCRG